MRIVKYILTDALSIILFTALFLFNPDNDGKVNIMIAMIIGFVASCAEMILVLYYLVSSLLNIYKKNVHILIFCLLCLSRRWTEEGKMIKLNFILGQSEFFDSLRNEDIVKFIDDKIVLLDKDAKEVWIARARCKREDSQGGSR